MSSRRAGPTELGAAGALGLVRILNFDSVNFVTRTLNLPRDALRFATCTLTTRLYPYARNGSKQALR